MSISSPSAIRHKDRLLVLAAATALAVALAVPAQAGKPSPSASATQSWVGCTRTATYTWSGFQGGGLVAVVGFVKSYGSESTGYSHQHGHGGTVTYTANGVDSSGFSVSYKAIGELHDRNGQVIPGSHAESSTESHNCY